jgi:hypothetical protein
MKQIDQIREIATVARAWAEHRNEQLDYAYDNDLGGMCAIASAHLLTQLHGAGFKAAHAVGNHGHYFVMWRGWVVDITASQFSKPDVYIVRHRDLSEEGEWKIEDICKTAWEIRSTQLKHKWPSGQTVWAELAAGLPVLPRLKYVRQSLGM